MQHSSTLTIDIGNTRVKYTLFQNGKVTRNSWSDTVSNNEISNIYRTNDISRTLISSVDDKKYHGITDILNSKHIPYSVLNHHTPLPFNIAYHTPNTLGLDRIAALAGGMSLYPSQPLLVIDIGTCITYDILIDNTFIGGNIAPGVQMRLDAMHHFTSALPAANIDIATPPIGQSTTSAMQAGAYWGVVYEIISYIKRYQTEHPQLLTIITGGGAQWVIDNLHDITNIVMQPMLVPIGLNFIATNLSNEYNNKQ